MSTHKAVPIILVGLALSCVLPIFLRHVSDAHLQNTNIQVGIDSGSSEDCKSRIRALGYDYDGIRGDPNKKDNDREYANFCQQLRSAAATHEAAHATRVQAEYSRLQYVAAKWSFVLVLLTTSAAISAAIFAWLAVKVTKEIATRQLRAHVLVESGDGIDRPSQPGLDPENEYEVLAPVVIRNTGMTLARDGVLACQIYFTQPRPFDIDYWEGEMIKTTRIRGPRREGLVVPPGHHIKLSVLNRNLSRTGAEDVDRKRKQIFVVGWSTYVDEFDDEKTIRFYHFYRTFGVGGTYENYHGKKPERDCPSVATVEQHHTTSQT